jgi:hypothetical protein
MGEISAHKIIEILKEKQAFYSLLNYNNILNFQNTNDTIIMVILRAKG